MSHLVLTFEYKKHQSYDLARHPLDPGAIPDCKFELHDATVLYNGKDTIIYRGMLERSEGVRREAVAKIGWHDTEPHSEKSLIREFILYNGLLKPLQRKIVPVCHGLFKGNTQFGVVTCLLLSYIGTHENSNTPWRMLTPDIKCVSMFPLSLAFHSSDDCRLKLVSAIKRLHRAGVQHNDIDSENVILNNGRWWVIDFGEATPHQCKRTMRIKEGIICPEPVGFGCGELWGITMALGVWRTGKSSASDYARCTF